jgi:surface carbohydrate biosynthesis protein
MGIETSDMTFGYPLALLKDGACWTSATDQEQIELFAETFLDLPENVWSSIHQELTPRLMVTDPGNRTFHDLLSAELGLQ